MFPFSILGIEYELGEEKIEISELFDNSKRIISRTGIECVFKTNHDAETLAIKAASRILEKFKVNPEVLIYVTQSQRYILPGSGVLVHNKLNLKSDCSVYDINAGCSGFVQALILSANLISTKKNILIICADQYREKLDEKDRSTRAVFSDGASAILISSEPKIRIGKLKTRVKGDFYHMLLQKKHDENNTHGKLSMSGTELWNFTRENIVPDINETLDFFKKNNIQCKDVFIHQASKVVVDGIENELKNSLKLHRNYQLKGNTVSSTIPILIKDSKIDINDNNSILSGFGVGLMSYTVGVFKLNNHENS